MRHLILKRSELISIAVALTILLAIAVFTALDWAQYRENRNQVLAARDIFEHTNLLQLAVTDAETGQRGYVLTGDPAYLAPYRQALEIIPGELEMLRRAETKPGLRDKAEQLRPLVQAKMDELARTVELRRNGDVQGALESVSSGRAPL